MSAQPPLELSAIDNGCRLGVRAQPGAKRSEVAGLWNGHVKVCVRAPAEDGRANDEVLDVLADFLELPRRALELERGQRARVKLVRIAAPLASVAARLSVLSAPDA